MKLSKITIASALLLSLASGYTLATDTTPAAPMADEQATMQAELDKVLNQIYPKPADFDTNKNKATNQSNFELMFKLGQISAYSDEFLAGLIEENKDVIEQQNDFLKYLDYRAYVMENRIDDNEENIIKLDKKADDLFAGLVYAEQGYEELRNDINNNQDDLEQLKDDMDGMKNTSVRMVEAIVKKAAPVLKNGVDANKEAIEKNKADIATNKATTEKNKTDIATNKATTEKNKTDIATNKETISENTAKIVALQTSSTANVEKLEKQVNSNTSDIKNVDDRVTKLDKDVKKGLATQAALNGLFQPYTVGKANISAAVGGYKSNTAIAVGTGYRFNENVAAKAGISVSTGGKAVSYNVGVNYEF